VQRLRHRCHRQAACLLAAACLALAGGTAAAQTAFTFPDPLAPTLQSNPRNPPRFEKVTPPSAEDAETPPPRFVPPASGAGLTGFDSSNARNKTKPTAKRTAAADVSALMPPPATLAPGTPAPAPVSPYQVPQLTPSGEGNTALAQAPATPPVEVIGPIRKPLRKRKSFAEPEDPFAPLGIHAGGFVLYPAIDFIGGHDSNPGQSAKPKAAKFYSVAPELRAQSNWSRHELTADLRGTYTGYSPDETPTLSRPYFDGTVEGRIDVTRQTRIDLKSRALVSTDNPGSPDVQAGLAKLPLYFTLGQTVGIGHTFNRFDVSLKGNYQRTAYQNSELTNGTIVSNADRSYDQYGGTLRGTYELTPGVKPFAEFGIDARRHDVSTDVNGYNRNSDGWTAKLGTTFELTHQLTGDIAVGYTHRNYEDPRFGAFGGLIGDASLVWTATPLTTVKLTADSSVAESNVAGVSGVLYRDVGLQVDHAFRQWLIGSLKLGFGIDTYEGGSSTGTTTATICGCVVSVPGETSPDRQDLSYSVGAGLTYKINRELWLTGEFRQNWLRSNVAGNNYAESIFLLGLRLQR